MTENCKNELDTLRHEFEAGDQSFLVKMRVELEWDREAFSRLTEAMRIYCEHHQGSEMIERWAAGGFYYFSWAVKDWTTHPNFPRVYPPEYYERAYQRLFELGCYFFDGDSPYETGTGFEPL